MLYTKVALEQNKEKPEVILRLIIYYSGDSEV